MTNQVNQLVISGLVYFQVERNMIMMFAPNSLVHQKQEEEAVSRGKAGSSGTLTPGADAPIGPTRSEVSDARNRRKHMDGGVGY